MNIKTRLAIASLCGVAAMTSTLDAQGRLSAREAARRSARHAVYVGLWQGVDEVDGGHSIRSILPNPGQSDFKVVGRDTWHGPCGYGDPATVIAEVDVDQRALQGIWALDCQAGDTAETGDRVFLVRYTYNPWTKALTETLLDSETMQPIDRIPIVFFRVAP